MQQGHQLKVREGDRDGAFRNLKGEKAQVERHLGKL